MTPAKRTRIRRFSAIVDSLNLRMPVDLFGISEKGLRNLADQLLSKYKARRVAGVSIPLTVFNDLNTYKQWVTDRKRQGLSTAAGELNAEAIAAARERVAELEILEAAEALAGVEKPEKFQSMEKFVEFDEAFDHHTSRVRGMSGVPIIWTYREHAEVTEEIRTAQYESRDAFLMATMVQSGPHFTVDNNKVYDLLKAATQDTLAETYVRPFERARDGRGAILALRLHCGAPATLEARSNKANEVVTTTIYKGRAETGRFLIATPSSPTRTTSWTNLMRPLNRIVRSSFTSRASWTRSSSSQKGSCQVTLR
jgi:hypothetical protein